MGTCFAVDWLSLARAPMFQLIVFGLVLFALGAVSVAVYQTYAD